MTGCRQRRTRSKHAHADKQTARHESGGQTCKAGFSGNGRGRVRVHDRTDSIILTGCRAQSMVALSGWA
ncbi:hypothetical protein AA3990_0262 [Gluconobacter roseus NBRC 3990]|nr:hypothetical protein AA3990_0262 [Gluconobacter roseus NBRC 3990]